MTAGVSVVVPSHGSARLPLLAGTLAAIRRSTGNIQIVVAEMGAAALAFDAAKNADADYVFSQSDGPFLPARTRNMGAALARHECIVWCDGDLVFAPDFLARASADFLAGGCDFSLHYDRIGYLNQNDTAAILNEGRDPAACVPLYSSDSRHANHLYFVRRDFLRRYGGMNEGFRRWGFEDTAFKHKADLLGRRTCAAGSGLNIWHLYHADSTAINFKLAEKTNPYYEANHRLLKHICSIADGQTLQRLYPPSPHAPLPWPASARIALVAAHNDARQIARAHDLAARLARFFGCDFPVGDTMPAIADLVVGFAEAPNDLAALIAARGNRPLVLLPGAAQPTALAHFPEHWIAAPTADAAAKWRAVGAPVWHRIDLADEAPTALQPMSHLLGQKRHWRLRIPLARAALGPAAFDRSPFWYVAFHDADGQEIARQDADRSEVRALAAAGGETAVIERQFAAACLPVRWTVQPVARNKIWLGAHSGAVDDSCLV